MKASLLFVLETSEIAQAFGHLSELNQVYCVVTGKTPRNLFLYSDQRYSRMKLLH